VIFGLHRTRLDATYKMSNIIRALLAGWGARKLGGGCLGTIIVFIILFWLLGYLF
jgi:hypothetical protein